jgi:hypothetical protein
MKTVYIPKFGTNLTLAEDWAISVSVSPQNNSLLATFGYRPFYALTCYDKRSEEFVSRRVVEIKDIGEGLSSCSSVYYNFKDPEIIQLALPSFFIPNNLSLENITEEYRINEMVRYTEEQKEEIINKINAKADLHFRNLRKVFENIYPGKTDKEILEFEGEKMMKGRLFNCTLPKGSIIQIRNDIGEFYTDDIYRDVDNTRSLNGSLYFIISWRNAHEMLGVDQILEYLTDEPDITEREIKNPAFYVSIEGMNTLKLID